MSDKPLLSRSSYATPRSIHEEPGIAVIHVSYPHGKSRRVVRVELGREDLLAMIANAADALRLLDEQARLSPQP